MKNVYLLAVLFICSFCLAQTDSISPYKLSITKVTVGRDGQGKYIDIPVTLKNTDKDTLFYANWSCSWQIFYKTDNPLLKPEEVNCDKNVLTRYALPPGDKNTVQLKLYYTNPKATNDISFRLGFNLLKMSKHPHRITGEERSKRNYIWSNTLSLPVTPVVSDNKQTVNPYKPSKGLRISAGYNKDFETEVAYIISPFHSKHPTGNAWKDLGKTAAAGLEYVKDGPRNAVGAKLSYEASFSLLIAQISADYLYSEAGNQARIMPKVGLSAFGFVTVYYGWNINTIKDSGLQPYKHLLSLQINILDIFL